MKTALILLNLGGPDALPAVRPFLFNLFYDPAIIRLPKPLRWLVATLISRRRAPVAEKIYEHMGGRSPILPNTEAQAVALEAALGSEFKCFIAMRYWHPRAEAQVKAVKAWAPDRVLLLPLYPQYSTTTTASSVAEWQREAARVGLTAPTQTLCCYPANRGFVRAVANGVRAGLAQFEGAGPRVLFSAHGLPKKIVEAGDPYQRQVEESVAAVKAELAMPALDTVVCYQSRVGPLEWLGPSTEAEVVRAGTDGKPLLLVPIAFVSEHSETLVELDIEYRHLATAKGVPAYVRVPTVDTDADFIAGLADEVRHVLAGDAPVMAGRDQVCCAPDRTGCPCARG